MQLYNDFTVRDNKTIIFFAVKVTVLIDSMVTFLNSSLDNIAAKSKSIIF